MRKQIGKIFVALTESNVPPSSLEFASDGKVDEAVERLQVAIFDYETAPNDTERCGMSRTTVKLFFGSACSTEEYSLCISSVIIAFGC